MASKKKSSYRGADIVEDGVNGIPVPERDAEALAQAMKQLMDAPNLARQMGQRGKEKYLASYTTEQFERKLMKILMEILCGVV